MDIFLLDLKLILSGFKMSTPKKYTANEKIKIVLEAIRGELTYAQITSKYGVHSTQINRWKQQALQAIESNFTGSQAKAIINQDELIAQLYQQIGKLTTECEWLKKKSELFR